MFNYLLFLIKMQYSTVTVFFFHPSAIFDLNPATITIRTRIYVLYIFNHANIM